VHRPWLITVNSYRAEKRRARERRDNAVECLKYRKEVRQVYSETVDRLKGEKEDDIRPLAEEIIRRIEANSLTMTAKSTRPKNGARDATS